MRTLSRFGCVMCLCVQVLACTESTPTPATQILVAITSDLVPEAELARIDVQVGEPDGSRVTSMESFALVSADAGTGQQTLPVTFSIGKGHTASFSLVVTGYGPAASDSAEKLVEQRYLATFQANKTLLLPVFLARACLREFCDNDSQRVCYPISSHGVSTGDCGPLLTGDLESVDPKQFHSPAVHGVTDAGDAGLQVPDSSSPSSVDSGAADGGGMSSAGSGGMGGMGGGGSGGRAVSGTGGSGGSGHAAGSGGVISNNPCATNNGGCDSHRTCMTSGSAVVCGECPAGYTDANGDGSHCTDIDECSAKTADCKSHSTCMNTPGTYACPCDTGYHGDGHQQCRVNVECDATGSNCGPLASCMPQGGIRYCVCNQFYAGDGVTCTDIDECMIDNGGCDTSPLATCTNHIGAAVSCSCQNGFSGSGIGAGGCADVDECANGAVAICGAGANLCTNSVGSFSCTCGAGYTGTGSTACADVNECAGGAAAVCGVGATGCSNASGSYSCTCGSGYSGTGASACADINECATNNGGCGDAANFTCTNVAGAAPTCGDVNECNGTNVCTSAYPCVNLTPYYTCRGQFADWTPSDDPTNVLTDNQNGTVSDSRTGLVWQQVLDMNSYTWTAASAYCASLPLVGGGWRLPSKVEFESSIDFLEEGPALHDLRIFPMRGGYYWSSSAVSGSSGTAWLININDGSSASSPTSFPANAWCVRSAASAASAASSGQGGAPPGRYTIGAGTVADSHTKLTWQQAIDGNTYSQATAVSYCTALTLAGGGWRLPVVSELLTLVDPTHSNPAIDPTAFPNTPQDSFWSATTYFLGGSRKWSVDFIAGGASGVSDSTAYHVRCVH